jgi:hypothetical protein
MRFFNDLFPDIAEKETLSIQVKNEVVPDGIYSFYEYFCENLACRCTTVVLDVLFIDPSTPEKGERIATIDYAWEQPLSHKNPVFHDESTQSDMAESVLTVFRHALKEDTSYPRTISEHFEMVRTYVRTEKQEASKAKENVSKYGRNDPCICGSGKKYKKCCLLK